MKTFNQFINENFKDLLKGKSEDEINKNISNLSLSELMINSIKSDYLEGVKQAIKKRYDVNSNEDIALRFAIYYENKEIIKYLLDQGANPRIWNNIIITSLKIQQNWDILKIVKNYI